MISMISTPDDRHLTAAVPPLRGGAASVDPRRYPFHRHFLVGRPSPIPLPSRFSCRSTPADTPSMHVLTPSTFSKIPLIGVLTPSDPQNHPFDPHWRRVSSELRTGPLRPGLQPGHLPVGLNCGRRRGSSSVLWTASGRWVDKSRRLNNPIQPPKTPDRPA